MTQKLDKQDIEILSVLTNNRKATLNEIAEHFKLKGIKITGEAIRKRIGKMKDISFPPLININELESMGLEPLIILLKIKGGKGLKEEILKKARILGGFFVFNTLGNFDMVCFFLIHSSRKTEEAREIIDKLKEGGDIETVFLFPIDYHLNSENLFNILNNSAG